MLFNQLRKVQKIISSSLTLCFVGQLIYPLNAFSITQQVMGESPVSASLSGMVNGYTGDFNYSVPLVTVPGPNGESVPISANYRGGIMVNQKASWIGLGWDYNPGEITRQVVGTPDDYRGKAVFSGKAYFSLNRVYEYGSIYNNNINEVPIVDNSFGIGNTKSCDVKTINYNIPQAVRQQLIAQTGQISNTQNFDPTSNEAYRLSTHVAPHKGLAYDQYSLSGPISGNLKPYFLGTVNLYDSPSNATSNLNTNARKAQFYFENSTNQSVTQSNYTSSSIVNPTTNEIHSGTRVKYFRNAEINKNTSLYNSQTNVGFLNDKPITDINAIRRPNTEHDSDLIGAFQVTDISGITYHYSLPVYSLQECNYSWPENDVSNLFVNYSPKKYASSWKLTAITGADYQDTNGNYTADEGDTGYWISYNYSLWSSDYFWASQRYNANTDPYLSKKLVVFKKSAAIGNHYSRRSYLTKVHTQVYALNYIKTATHTAYFIKSVRKDEQSYDNIHNTEVKPTPLLKLDRIVLLRNEDKTNLINSISLSSTDKDSRFNYSSCSVALSDINFINVTRYTVNKPQIDAAALKTVEFITDYSLSKKYMGNINNTFLSTPFLHLYGYGSDNSVNGGTNTTYRSYVTSDANFSTTDLANSGKLSLKKINFYDLNGEKITPSIDFSYDEQNPLKNPDYNQDKTDLWGYYKKDYVNSHYVTSVSKDDVDAWSLKEINTSLGGKIKIQYESDIYHQEGFSDDPPFYPVIYGGYYDVTDLNKTPVASTTPHLIFPIKEHYTTIANGNPTDAIAFYDADFYSYYHTINEPYYDPSYKRAAYLVEQRIDHCSENIQYYGSSYNSFYPPRYERLVRYGNKILELPHINTIPSPSTYLTNDYTNLINSNYIGEINISSGTCQNPGYEYTDVIGTSHVAVFRSYLYGGGIRVKQIDINEPFKNNTYSQKFTYGNGYCPVVPKAMQFSTDAGPTNHDLIFNNKSLMTPFINSVVGYDFFVQTTENENHSFTGYVSSHYVNVPIPNPINDYNTRLTAQYVNRCDGANWVAGACSICSDREYADASTSNNPIRKYAYYDIRMDLSLNNSKASMLGKLIKQRFVNSKNQEVSSTDYFYETNQYILEDYYHDTQKTDVFNPYFKVYYPVNSSCSQAASSSVYKGVFKDEYHFSNSQVKNYNTFLSGTITYKDGIKITNGISLRDSYTAEPIQTFIYDPTKGSYSTFVTPAYLVGAYNTLGLKTVNETYRNQPSLTYSTQTVKNGEYVIGESYVTYSNSYPIRTYNTATNKYTNISPTKPWYRLNETYTRLLDDDVLKSVTPQISDYRKTSVGTLYDAQYNRIEEEGLNHRKTASKWGYNNKYQLCSISNANYNSFTFSSFEDQVTFAGSSVTHFGGEITNGQLRTGAVLGAINPAPVVMTPHTGSYMAKVDPNTSGPSFNTENFEKGRTYIAKVWVHKNSPATAALNVELSGALGSSSTPVVTYTNVAKNNASNITVGNWTLMSVEIEVPTTFNLTGTHYLSVYLSNPSGSGVAYFDDFSFHPKDAVMSGNVYNNKTGLLVAQLDNENFATTYNYDNAGRVTTTYKEYSGGIKKVTESIYHFAKP